MHDQHKLRFPLLSDAGNKVARQFGLTYRVPAAQEAVYRRAFVNLPFTNGDDSWELPIPATYILDRDGTVLYASRERGLHRAAGTPRHRRLSPDPTVETLPATSLPAASQSLRFVAPPAET